MTFEEDLKKSSMGHFTWYPQEGNIQFSGECFTMLDYPEKKGFIPLNALHPLFLPSDKIDLEKKINYFLKGDQDIYREFFHLRKRNNEFRWFEEILIVAERNEDNQPKMILGYHRDVTGIKHKEELLRASLILSNLSLTEDIDTVLQAFLDESEHLTDSHIGFFHLVMDDEKTLQLQTWSTNTLEKMCSMTMKGNHYPIETAGIWTDCVRLRTPVIHNDYPSLKNKKGLPEGHAPITREMVIPLIRDGKIRFIVGLGNKETSYTEEDVVIVSELAEMTWELLERKRAERDLKETKNYLDNIINSIPSIVVGVDRGCKITHWNNKAAQAAAVFYEDGIGQELFALFPGYKDKKKLIETCMVKKEVQREHHCSRIEGGTERYENWTASPLVVEKVIGAVIQIEDVTKEHQREEQFLHSQKLDAIGQLAGGIAHDINNTLTGILGATQLLSVREQDKKFIDLIIKSVENAADLTRKLLAFGRKSKIGFTPFDIHQVLMDIHTIMQKTLDKRIVLSLDLTASRHIVLGDSASLQSAIINLCINASHVMPEGGDLHLKSSNIVVNEEYSEISVLRLSPGEYIDITVSDSGTGIPRELLTKIFEPFFTTKKEGKGTGLGLSAVYGTMQSHHGDIKVYSEVGLGTVFHLYLPCSDQNTEQIKINSEVITGTGTILLIDDEEMIRTTCKLMLERMGYFVLTAKNGEEGYQVYCDNSQRIDVVITDMLMPSINGKQLFYKLKVINPSCKVILASGFSRDVHLTNLKEEGLVGFLQKPYRDYELSQILNYALSDYKRKMLQPGSL